MGPLSLKSTYRKQPNFFDKIKKRKDYDIFTSNLKWSIHKE